MRGAVILKWVMLTEAVGMGATIVFVFDRLPEALRGSYGVGLLLGAGFAFCAGMAGAIAGHIQQAKEAERKQT